MSNQKLSAKDEIAIELLENSPDAMLALSPSGTVVYWNKGAERTFGYTKAEALGRELSELIIPTDPLEEEEEYFQEVIDSGYSNFEAFRKRKDGSLIHVEIATRAIRDDQGTIKYLISSKKDITKRKLLEEERQTTELRYRRLFESAKDGILILDSDTGRIVDVNPYLIEMLGFSKAELEGKELWEIGVFKDIAASKIAFDELQERGYIRYDDLPLKDRLGNVRQVEFVSNSYLVGQSSVIQCNIRDITERKLAEGDLRKTNLSLAAALEELQVKTRELGSITQQLWQASKLATMGELAASVAHELNNPLTTISLQVETLIHQLSAGDPSLGSLVVIEQEVDRMATLVSKLLVFSRHSHRQLSTLDIRDELSETLDFVAYHLRNHEIEVVQDFGLIVLTVGADRDQLRQVFLNLITNSCDAMPKGGVLTVKTRAGVLSDGRSGVVIEFSDTGTGVQTGDLPKLWEPFFTTKPAGKGTGLGLSICRRTVEEHRGTIEIETAPAKGTTVRITLPATEEVIEAAA